jgi:hypothetical protein
MENLDQESNSQYQAEILIFFEPRFPTGRICLEEGKFTASYFLLPSVSEAAHYSWRYMTFLLFRVQSFRPSYV